MSITIPINRRRFPHVFIISCLFIGLIIYNAFSIKANLLFMNGLINWVFTVSIASRKGVKPNARFVVNPRTGSARLETSRPIQAGGEIFVSYGSELAGGHSSSHSTSLVPVWEWDLSDPFAQLHVARVPSPGPLAGSVHADLCPGSVPAGGFAGILWSLTRSIHRTPLFSVALSLCLCLLAVWESF